MAIFSSMAKDLNSGLSRINLASSQGETTELRASNFQLQHSNHSATLPLLINSKGTNIIFIPLKVIQGPRLLSCDLRVSLCRLVHALKRLYHRCPVIGLIIITNNTKLIYSLRGS